MKRWLFYQTAALFCGFWLDFFIGDPHALPHPVVGIGRLISWLEKKLRHGDRNPCDVGTGVLTVLTVSAVSTLFPALLLFFAWRVSPLLYCFLEALLCGQLLAARQLARESAKVQRAVERGQIEEARRAVSMIVGRDTDGLDEGGILRAAVETVAENTSDGVIAPLFWMTLFGAAGGFFYKSVNTMDSMIGYKNDKYLYFGRAAAKTDDFVNFLPARLSGLLMILVSPLCGLDAKNAWRIFLRDRKKHESPNSAQTEAAAAGALGLRLAGDAVYGGIPVHKPTLGDPKRDIEPMDVARVNRLMYVASGAALVLALLLRGVWLRCF